MNLVIACIGLFFSAEGVANILYWRNDDHPWYFQVGRFVRVALGIALIAVAVPGIP